jgi:FkbM family methyltransferase
VSKTLARLITGFAALITASQNPRRGAITRAIASEQLQQRRDVAIDGVEIAFHCPSGPTVAGADALSRAEPETRAWIRDHVGPGDVLWDIGANIGLFSFYAAKLKGARVFAFEPSAGTYQVLTRNVALNGLEDLIRALPIALSDRSGLDTFYLWRKEVGHAMGAVGRPENVAGPFTPAGKQTCLKLSVGDVLRLEGMAPPDHIKLDVDGHEPQILESAGEALARVKTVCVELLPEAPDANARITRALAAAGLAPLPAEAGRERNTVFIRR